MTQGNDGLQVSRGRKQQVRSGIEMSMDEIVTFPFLCNSPFLVDEPIRQVQLGVVVTQRLQHEVGARMLNGGDENGIGILQERGRISPFLRSRMFISDKIHSFSALGS